MTAQRPDIDALQRALISEHEAVYAYGSLGARYPDVRGGAALDSYRLHRKRRNATIALIERLGEQPVGAAAVVDLPNVTSTKQAVALGRTIERRCLARWTGVIGVTTDGTRAFAVTMMGDTAVSALTWGVRPIALPGLAR
ncbi:MAG: hypothetical protein JWP10_107 [Nocardioidaceae bacterium]|nr:hypothetical protein [Nocardioidaceae bacterium]